MERKDDMSGRTIKTGGKDMTIGSNSCEQAAAKLRMYDANTIFVILSGTKDLY